MTGGLGHRLSSDELNDPFSLAGAQRPPRPIETDFGGPRNKSAKDYGHNPGRGAGKPLAVTSRSEA